MNCGHNPVSQFDYYISGLNEENAKLKAEIDRLKNYEISGYEVMLSELKADLSTIRNYEESSLGKAHSEIAKLKAQLSDAVKALEEASQAFSVIKDDSDLPPNLATIGNRFVCDMAKFRIRETLAKLRGE
jgi:uncharacterized small protein (DUF1192 family)